MITVEPLVLRPNQRKCVPEMEHFPAPDLRRRRRRACEIELPLVALVAPEDQPVSGKGMARSRTGRGKNCSHGQSHGALGRVPGKPGHDEYRLDLEAADELFMILLRGGGMGHASYAQSTLIGDDAIFTGEGGTSGLLLANTPDGRHWPLETGARSSLSNRALLMSRFLWFVLARLMLLIAGIYPGDSTV